MKKLLLLSFLFISIIGFSQDTDIPAAENEVKEGWTRGGNASLLFNQAAFNNEWAGGGVSNISGNLSLTYKINYNKGGLVWDNILLAEYGLTKLKEDAFARKTNDRLAINSILGKQIKESNWYYSVFINFKTQMDSGYEDADTPLLDGNGGPIIVDGNPLFETGRVKTTHFFSPAYLQVGPGLLWKKSENLKVNISPLASKFVFVHDEFTSRTGQVIIDDFNNNGGYFGVEANETIRYEFGASIEAYAKFNLMENIVFENFVNLYSNYVEDPQNVDIDYTANIIFTVNKWITANITFQAIYDDNAVQGFQIRETLGVGVAHSF